MLAFVLGRDCRSEALKRKQEMVRDLEQFVLQVTTVTFPSVSGNAPSLVLAGNSDRPLLQL